MFYSVRSKMRVERLLGWANGSGEQQEAKNGPPFQKPNPKRYATPRRPHSNYTRKSDYGVFPDAKAAGDAVAVSFLYSDLA